MLSFRPALALWLFLLTSPVWASPPFSDLTLPEAREAAGTDRYLLVYLTATWCGPCQTMKNETWPEPEVVGWVQQKGLAIMLDVDQEPELAKGLRYSALPTLLVLRDGQEIDRMAGRQDKAELLSWLSGLESGRTSLDVFREKAQSGNVYDQLDYAEALLERERGEEGFRILSLLFDTLIQGDSLPGYSIRALDAAIETFRKRHPPAVQYFLDQHEVLARRVDALEPTPKQWKEWVVLSSLIDKQGEVVALHDKLEASSQLSRLAPIREEIYVVLLDQGRWAQAGRLVSDPEATARRHLDVRDKIMADAEELHPGNPEEFRESFRGFAREDLGRLYWALRAADNSTAADQVLTIWRSRDLAEPIEAALAKYKP